MALSPEVTLSISAEWSKLNTTLNDASRKINSWAAESGGAFKNFEKSVLAFTTRVAAIAAPFAAVGGALAVMAQRTATAGDEILKMGQKIGVPVEKLSALKYAAELSDVSMDELGTSLGHLSKSIVDASAGTGEAGDTFKALGINVKDVSGKIKPTDTLLLELADKFSTMEDSAGKTSIAMALFGKSGKEMIPFLNQGRDGIKELTDEAEKMGLVFSKDSASAANKFNDNITKIKEQINALVYAIGNQLIPAFNQLIGSCDGVLKIGYAIGGIFQGAASSTLFLSAGIFKIISGLALLTDKLGLTTNQYAKWKEESTLALEASIDLAKKAQGNILDLFIPTPAFAQPTGKREGKKSAAPEIVDTKKREAEIAAFLKKSEEETKRHLEKLSGMREKQVDENLELEKKSHSEMWGVIQEYNKKMVEADRAGLIDRTGIYEWFRLQVGEIRKKEMKDEIDEAGKKNSFIEGLQNQILSAQRELYGEEWILVEEYYQKKAEAAKIGAEAELELEKWLVAEMEAVRNKIKPPEPPKKWYEGMKDFQAGLSAISSGSISQIAGLFGEAGKLIGGIIELIANIGKLPDMLKKSLAGLVQGARDFGQAIVTIIKDIIANLPSILYDIITSLMDSVDDIMDALIKALPKFFTQLGKVIPSIIKSIIDATIQLVSKIPELVYEIINALWEGLKALLVGGEITSGITDTWNEEAKDIKVELDTSGAMQALKYAQDALLGAVNETDRKVAREALLSARSAAILAEKQSQERQQQAQAKTFKGLFGYLGELFENIFKNAWEGLKGIFTWAWDGIKGVFTWAWDGLRGAIVGLWDFLKEIPGKIWDGIKGIAGLIGKAIADAWEGIKNALGLGGGGTMGGIISSGSNLINSISHGFGLWHSGGLIKKAHSGMYLKDDEVPIIAQFGEGILNKYKGMTAIGGEEGLNYANRYGSLPGGGKTEIHNTYHQNFEVVVDKDGNVMKLTRTQAKNLARTLDPVFKEMKRNRELSFA